MTVMRRPAFSSKAFALLSLTVVLSLLVTTVVYACSGLNMFQMNAHQSTMKGEGVKRGPCAEHKQDICKSVRDRMLSIQPSAHKAENSQILVVLLLPSLKETTENVVFAAEPLEREILYHPVFKLSLPFSYLVLRI